jgi:hypothetical protein
MKLCHHCGHEIVLTSGLQRTDGCPYCHSDLKCCLNCRFFDPGASNQCAEPQVDPVPDKSKASFCEFFAFREVSASGRPGMGGAQSDKENARAAFDALFTKRR